MSTLPTTSAIPLYAGFWRRVAASGLDALILVIPLVIVTFLIQGGALHDLVLTIVAGAYFAGFHSSRLQATLGKKAFGIKVTNQQGERIGLGRAIGRYFASVLSSLLLGIGFLLAAFTKKRVALHDMVCSTFVVNVSAQPSEVLAGGGVMPVSASVRTVGIIVCMVPVVGFLAGIMVPAYHDYTLRAMVTEVIGASGPLKADVERAISERRAWTTGEVSIGSKYASGAQVTSNGDVVVNVIDEISPGGRIRFMPSTNSGAVQWKCAGEDVPAILLPPTCRE